MSGLRRIPCPAHDGRDLNCSVWSDEYGRKRAKCWSHGCAELDILVALEPNRLAARNSDHTLEHRLDCAMRTKRALHVWCESHPPAGTTVERYLRTRGITTLLPPSIRFRIGRHAPSQTGPWAIMVASVQNLDDELVAIHRTYLTGDGRKAPVDPVKMALGPIAGGAARLVKAGKVLALAEGIETALSVQQATGLATWATLGTSNLACVELPAVVREVIICADADKPGETVARDAAARFLREGRAVRIARPGSCGDFNDALNA